MIAFRPLRAAAFRRLAVSYALNELAWGFGTVALAVLVYAQTGSPLATTALFVMSGVAPALLAPALTARVDQRPTGRTLAALYGAEATVFCLLALTAAESFVLPVVLALAFVDGAIALTGRALTRAAVAAVLEPRGELRDGNALLNVLFAICMTAGPAIGGLVVAGWGTTVSLLVAATLFALMALTMIRLRGVAQPDGERVHWQTRLREGLAYTRRHPGTRRLLVLQGVTLLVCVLAVPIEVVYARESLHGHDGTYGVLLATWGAGTIIGSLIFARAKRVALHVLIPTALAITAGGYGILAGAPSLTIAAIGCVIGGAGNGIEVVAVIQTLQERIAADFQARVMGLFESVNAAAVGIGFVIGGTIATLATPRLVFAVAAGGVLATAVVFALILPRQTAASTTTADRPPARPLPRPEPATELTNAEIAAAIA